MSNCKTFNKIFDAALLCIPDGQRPIPLSLSLMGNAKLGVSIYALGIYKNLVMRIVCA